jgi:hypothetical protein
MVARPGPKIDLSIPSRNEILRMRSHTNTAKNKIGELTLCCGAGKEQNRGIQILEPEILATEDHLGKLRVSFVSGG